MFWDDATCHNSAKPCAVDNVTAISVEACKCAAESTSADCDVGKWCWDDNTCQLNEKPNPCTPNNVNDLAADCQCDLNSTTAECTAGEWCWDDNTCNSHAKPCVVNNADPITGEDCRCTNDNSTGAECVADIDYYCITGNIAEVVKRLLDKMINVMVIIV